MSEMLAGVVNSFTGKLFRVNPRTGVTKEIDLGGTQVRTALIDVDADGNLIQPTAQES